jgi:hypothetical protein
MKGAVHPTLFGSSGPPGNDRLRVARGVSMVRVLGWMGVGLGLFLLIGVPFVERPFRVLLAGALMAGGGLLLLRWSRRWRGMLESAA